MTRERKLNRSICNVIDRLAVARPQQPLGTAAIRYTGKEHMAGHPGRTGQNIVTSTMYMYEDAPKSLTVLLLMLEHC